MQWIYGLFLDLMSYCANALLGVMSTDLSFFESSVPIVPGLYKVFVAIGWGLLIGNCAFQAMKAMFAGFGFETESPAILLLRTFLFGTLLVFSKDICDIGLSIGKNVINLLGIPSSITLTMPNESFFTGMGASWLLVIIIGFILGFQLIKLFFEIAERYVIVAVLTLLCPVGLAMGGSKSTKDICVGFMRTYASMIVMMVMNVLFLKLILSALATMPTGALVLPWCLLVVGIAKTARKADQLISKIGLSPAITGDPLGTGRGLMLAAMAARTIISTAGKGGHAKGSGGKQGSATNNNSARNYSGNVSNNVRNTAGGTNVGGTNVGGSNVGGNNVGGNHTGGNNVGGTNVTGSNIGNSMAVGAAYASTVDSSANSMRNNHNVNAAGNHATANTQSASTVRFGANSYGSNGQTINANSGSTQFNSSGKAQINTNRFGSQSVQNTSKTTGSAQLFQSHTSSNNTKGGISANNAPSAKTQHPNIQNGVGGKTQTFPNNKSANGTSVKGGVSAGNAEVANSQRTTPQNNKSAKTSYGSQTGSKNDHIVGNPGATRTAQQTYSGKKDGAKPVPKQSAQNTIEKTKKVRFGGPTATHNAQNTPTAVQPKNSVPNSSGVKHVPDGTKNSAKPDNIEATDTPKEVLQDMSESITAPKDGENNG